MSIKIIAVASVYDEGFTFSREIDANLDLTDQEILEFMYIELENEIDSGMSLLDSCVLIQVSEDDVIVQELVER